MAQTTTNWQIFPTGTVPIAIARPFNDDPVGGDTTATVSFRTGTFAEVQAEAVRLNRPMLVDVYTTWCGPCKLLEKTVFTGNPTFPGWANQSVVSLRIDAEKGEGIALKEKYAVVAYPTMLLLNPDGSEIDRFLGVAGPGELADRMGHLIRGDGTAARQLALAEARPGDFETQRRVFNIVFLMRKDAAKAIAPGERMLAAMPADLPQQDRDELRSLVASARMQTGDTAPMDRLAADTTFSMRRAVSFSLVNGLMVHKRHAEAFAVIGRDTMLAGNRSPGENATIMAYYTLFLAQGYPVLTPEQQRQALAIGARAVALAPESSYAHYVYATLLFRDPNRRAEAIRVAEQSVRLATGPEKAAQEAWLEQMKNPPTAEN